MNPLKWQGISCLGISIVVLIPVLFHYRTIDPDMRYLLSIYFFTSGIFLLLSLIFFFLGWKTPAAL
jgi:hypothetical protein